MQARQALILLTALALTPLLMAPSFAVAQTLNLKGFSIEIPNGWIQAPQEEINKFNQRTIQRTGKSQNYEYGFQPQGLSRWFDFPYILIRRSTAGRWTDKDIAGIDQDFANAGQKYTTKYKNLISSVSTKQGQYDPKRNIVWKVFNLQSPKVGGGVSGLSGSVLTSNGYIQIIAYDKSAQFESRYKAYRAMIESIKLSSELRYDAPASTTGGRPSAPLPAGRDFGLDKLAALAAMLVLGAILVKYFRKT